MRFSLTRFGARRARVPRLAPGFLLACVLATGTRAEAQSSANEKAAAEALFQEAKTLFDQGQYEEACSKFAASQELDAGFGTLMNLGECYERRGMTASAWATLKEAAGLARASGQTDRETTARARATALEARLSKLVVSVDPAVLGVPGLEVRLNGTALPRAVWGSPVPVDPGTQQVEVSAPGYRPWSSELVAPSGPGESKIVVGELEPEAAPSPTPTPSSAGPAELDISLTQAPPDDGRTQRTIGYALAGAGAVGLTIGSIFGLQAFSKNSDSDEACRTERFCSERGLSLRDDARDAATVSTIAFIAGGALAASGVSLILTAPSAAESEPAVGQLRLTSLLDPSSLGFWMEGAW